MDASETLAVTTGGVFTVRASSGTSMVVGTSAYAEMDAFASGDYASLPLKTGFSKKKKVYEPQVFFRYAKRKFSTLELVKLKSRLRILEKAATEAYNNGQLALGKKCEDEWLAKLREAEMAAKGIKHYIEASDLADKKRQIRDGHISDTKLKDFTRAIPKDVLKKLNKARPFFDDFIVYHYWNENAADVKKMTPKEKERMKDPILFGVIRETDRLYFIADWEDEHCDLTFEELTEIIAKKKV